MRIRWRNFELPSQVRMDRETATNQYGRFVVEPFEKGFGSTIGNGLRRVLLSSIEGTAVTWVKIDGVVHEFSTISGVLEDVTQIILNIKKLRVKMHTDALMSRGRKVLSNEVGSDRQLAVSAIHEDCESNSFWPTVII